MDIQGNAGLSAVFSAHSPIDPILAEPSDTPRLSLYQLQSAIADISRALNEALRVDCTNAVLYLRRAENFLKPAAPPEISRTVNPGPRLTTWQRRRVLEHIETNLATPLRNRDLAALVDFSEFHFNVAFRNSLGTSPHEFLIRRRIEHAQQLMLSTGKPLCDIASECGFADQAHLSRLFRKVIGETPAAWRKCRVSDAAGPSGSAPRRSLTRSDGSRLQISLVR
jgi:AraC family transcriptional regulator